MPQGRPHLLGSSRRPGATAPAAPATAASPAAHYPQRINWPFPSSPLPTLLVMFSRCALLHAALLLAAACPLSPAPAPHCCILAAAPAHCLLPRSWRYSLSAATDLRWPTTRRMPAPTLPAALTDPARSLTPALRCLTCVPHTGSAVCVLAARSASWRIRMLPGLAGPGLLPARLQQCYAYSRKWARIPPETGLLLPLGDRMRVVSRGDQRRW